MKFSITAVTALVTMAVASTAFVAADAKTNVGNIKVSRAIKSNSVFKNKIAAPIHGADDIAAETLRRRLQEDEEGGQEQDQDQQQDENAGQEEQEQQQDENAEEQQQQEQDAEGAEDEQAQGEDENADAADDAEAEAANTMTLQGVGCQAFTRELQNANFDAGNYFFVGQESVVYFTMDLSSYTMEGGQQQNANDGADDAVSYSDAASGSTFMVMADTWMATMAEMAGYQYNGCMQIDEEVVKALTGYVDEDEAQNQDAADDADDAGADAEAEGGERRNLRRMLRNLEDEAAQQQLLNLYLGAVCDNGSLQLAVFFDNECKAYSPALTYELSMLDMDSSSSQQGDDGDAAGNEEEQDALTFYQTLLAVTGVKTQYSLDCDQANNVCQQFIGESVSTSTCMALNAEEEQQQEEQQQEEDGQVDDSQMTYQLYQEDLQDLESTCAAVQKAVSSGEDLRTYLQQQGQYVAKSTGLSAGAKAGIVIASFAVMALILYVVLQERKRSSPAKRSDDTVGSNDSKKAPLIREDLDQVHKVSPNRDNRSYTRKTSDI